MGLSPGPDFCAHACGTLIPRSGKNAPYEWFRSVDDARMKFDVKFYLVAILFIIFDLEVAFLFLGLSLSAMSACSGFGQ